VTIDVRETEAAAQSDEIVLIRPAPTRPSRWRCCTCSSPRARRSRLRRAAYDRLSRLAVTSARTRRVGRGITGIAAERIVDLARRYASTRPAMIVVGGSSMHKASNGWHAARAIACLPALTGQVGIAAAGSAAPRASLRGQVLGSIVALDRRPPATTCRTRLPRITESLVSGRVRVLLLFGTDMLSSFADATAWRRGSRAGPRRLL